MRLFWSVFGLAAYSSYTGYKHARKVDKYLSETKNRTKKKRG